MSTLTVASAQFAPTSWERDPNLTIAERLIEEAANKGAQVVLPPENMSMHFFGFNDWDPAHFKYADTLEGETVTRMRVVAKRCGVVVITNFFEKANNAYFNTNAIIDADGEILGIYRKTHIPGGPPGCYEKVYTSFGNTGFKVWKTAHGTIGAGICWDQWFPEAARIMALMGADCLFYPTAIGSDCHDHWEVVMRGHAGANIVPLVCTNRIGTEKGPLGETTFFGQSFISGPQGNVLQKANDHSETVLVHSFDLAEIAEMRANWGVFRDRRPDAYGPLLTLDGTTPAL